jgi:hypothetical protein
MRVFQPGKTEDRLTFGGALSPMGRLDIYTKVVFTVIAVALSAIAIENVGAGAFAQGITQVELCGQELNPSVRRPVSCAEILTGNDGVRRLVITR